MKSVLLIVDNQLNPYTLKPTLCPKAWKPTLIPVVLRQKCLVKLNKKQESLEKLIIGTFLHFSGKQNQGKD